MRIETFCMYLYKVFVCITTILCINILVATADVTEEITAIAKDIKNNPTLWSVDQHEFCRYKNQTMAVNYACSTSDPSLLTIWISNGVDYIKISHPYQLRLDKTNRILLWNAYMGWLDNYRDNHISKNFKDYAKQTFGKDGIKPKEDARHPTIKFLEDKKDPKKEFTDSTITEEEDEYSGINGYKLMAGIFTIIAIIGFFVCYITRTRKA